MSANFKTFLVGILGGILGAGITIAVLNLDMFSQETTDTAGFTTQSVSAPRPVEEIAPEFPKGDLLETAGTVKVYEHFIEDLDGTLGDSDGGDVLIDGKKWQCRNEGCSFCKEEATTNGKRCYCSQSDGGGCNWRDVSVNAVGTSCKESEGCNEKTTEPGTKYKAIAENTYQIIPDNQEGDPTTLDGVYPLCEFCEASADNGCEGGCDSSANGNDLSCGCKGAGSCSLVKRRCDSGSLKGEEIKQ